MRLPSLAVLVVGPVVHHEVFEVSRREHLTKNERFAQVQETETETEMETETKTETETEIETETETETETEAEMERGAETEMEMETETETEIGCVNGRFLTLCQSKQLIERSNSSRSSLHRHHQQYVRPETDLDIGKLTCSYIYTFI